MPELEDVAAATAAIGAGVGARNASTAIWRRITGTEPPKDPSDPLTSWGEAIAWSVTVGIIVGIFRVVARRAARKVASG